MKSFIDTFTVLYDALCKDITDAYPSIGPELERDLNRLQSSLRSEGLSFITITHGRMEKALLRALSGKQDLRNATHRERGMGAKGGRESVLPSYMHGLWSLIFTSDGTLHDEVDPLAVFFLRQWFNLARKVEIACSDERVSNALAEWVQIDVSLPDHHPNTWDDNVPVWSRRFGHPLYGDAYEKTLPLLDETPPEDRKIHWNWLGELSATLVSSFGIFDPWTIRPKHGPGANADQKMGLKYEFPNWPDKLQSMFPWDFFASGDFGLYRREMGTQPDTREIPCVMYAVPKTQDAPRLIAAEPIAHQWIQGGIQRWFEDGVRRGPLGRFIDFGDQKLSQEMAFAGSMGSGHATVDLSAASDRLSSRLVEYIFQINPDLLDALHASRSRLVKLPDGSFHRMRKFAPMGSAVCFPVQTIVFTCLALFALQMVWSEDAGRKIPPRQVIKRALGDVRVFGDDIILPEYAYGMLHTILSHLKLKVNDNKSYATGYFRESCGLDAYRGSNVTPVRVKKVYSASDPSTLQAVVDASNNLFKVGLWHTSAALLKTVPLAERKLITVGDNVGGALSLFSFNGTSNPWHHVVWDEDLHRWKRKALVVTSVPTTAQSEGDASLIQFFFEEPDPLEKFSSGQVIRVRSVKRRSLV